MDADNKSHAEESSNRLWHQIDDFRNLIPTLYADEFVISKDTKSPVNGNDIMNTFNISPGPLVKEYLEKATDIFDEDPSLTKAEIIEILKNK